MKSIINQSYAFITDDILYFLKVYLTQNFCSTPSLQLGGFMKKSPEDSFGPPKLTEDLILLIT